MTENLSHKSIPPTDLSTVKLFISSSHLFGLTTNHDLVRSQRMSRALILEGLPYSTRIVFCVDSVELLLTVLSIYCLFWIPTGGLSLQASCLRVLGWVV